MEYLLIFSAWDYQGFTCADDNILMIRYTGCSVLIYTLSPTQPETLKYLLLQLQNLLFQLPHFGLFPVSGCLSCDSVLEFPGGEVGGRCGGEKKKKRHEFDTFFPWCWVSSPSLPLTWLGSQYCATNRPCSCHVDIPGYQYPAASNRSVSPTSRRHVSPGRLTGRFKVRRSCIKGFKERFVAVSACRPA